MKFCNIKNSVQFLPVMLVSGLLCANSNATEINDAEVWSSLELGDWKYFVNKDEFTNEVQCVIEHKKVTSNSNGVDREKSVQLQGFPEEELLALFLLEKERVKAYDPEFGMINKGPYTPWPELTKNADIKVGDKVTEGYIGYSQSTADDQFTSGIWKRKTLYAARKDFLDNTTSGDDLKLRIESVIYEVPRTIFTRFLKCIEYK